MTFPDWLMPYLNEWSGFVEMRKRFRNVPFTERAMTITINKLEQLRAEGYNVGEVLDQSTQRGWRGVFPVYGQEPKRESKPQANYSASDKAYYNEMRKKHPELSWPA